MLDQTITLASTALYDTDGVTPLTAGNVVYERHSMRGADRVDYIGPGHAEGVGRDTMSISRSYAKRSGNSLGVRRASVKLTQDINVPNADGSGELQMPLICDLRFAIPQGATVQETHNLRMIMKQVLATEIDTICDPLVDTLEI